MKTIGITKFRDNIKTVIEELEPNQKLYVLQKDKVAFIVTKPKE